IGTPNPLETINEIARIANLDLALRPMLQRITDALAQKFDWEFVALIAVNEPRTAFVCEAVTSALPTEIHAGYGRELGSGVVGEVAATELPIVLDDVRTSSNYVETMPGTLSEICMPVKHAGKLVAILNIESTRAGAFHDELPLLTTAADQIAGAIANARLFEETHERARLMEMMSEVSRSALEADDLQDLLDRIVHYVHERFPVQLVSIVVPETRAVAGQTDDASDAHVVPIRFRGETLGDLRIESTTSEVFTPANVIAFELFANQVAGAIRLARMKRDLEEANEHLAGAIETLHRMSNTDALTATANRRHFDDTLTLEWRRAVRNQTPVSLALADIDFFKLYNDTHGHQAGDEMLRRVAQTLQSQLHRAGDLVARYGGEEFAILLVGVDAEHARAVAERARAAVEALGDVTISAGVATIVPARDNSSEELVRAADAALYEAKRAGRNRVR
ncbi:MAG TPA: sensor domain-containing diguanylate cyclase, partial [Thermoanaerobaculia bacterium]|nr:sensor domain-containing diguanylate cyclase [Thermoanaerobaculia bacterium]